MIWNNCGFMVWFCISFAGYANQDWFIPPPALRPSASQELTPEQTKETLNYFCKFRNSFVHFIFGRVVQSNSQSNCLHYWQWNGYTLSGIVSLSVFWPSLKTWVWKLSLLFIKVRISVDLRWSSRLVVIFGVAMRAHTGSTNSFIISKSFHST